MTSPSNPVSGPIERISAALTERINAAGGSFDITDPNWISTLATTAARTITNGEGDDDDGGLTTEINDLIDEPAPASTLAGWRDRMTAAVDELVCDRDGWRDRALAAESRAPYPAEQPDLGFLSEALTTIHDQLAAALAPDSYIAISASWQEPAGRFTTYSFTTTDPETEEDGGDGAR